VSKKFKCLYIGGTGYSANNTALLVFVVVFILHVAKAHHLCHRIVRPRKEGLEAKMPSFI
jgi:hypothetical protein